MQESAGEFRVEFDLVMQTYYVYHTPLDCDWERDLVTQASSGPLVSEVLEAIAEHAGCTKGRA